MTHTEKASDTVDVPFQVAAISSPSLSTVRVRHLLQETRKMFVQVLNPRTLSPTITESDDTGKRSFTCDVITRVNELSRRW